ncbi:MAG: helix-turn-helix domain-containing protein, partial [Pseudonocardiaceae bacterium]
MINTRKREVSPRYLSEDERVRIADLELQGLGVRAVGVELGRDPGMISRELRLARAPSSDPKTVEPAWSGRRPCPKPLPISAGNKSPDPGTEGPS